ncbi:MAG TPA: TIM barrel protein [Sedimentisphaerales bacterium]|nr:TIM barrel protein [Sedimentisphaerales bacterium]
MKELTKAVCRRDGVISRRAFIGKAVGTAIAVSAAASLTRGQDTTSPKPNRKFKLRYAPSLGQFKNHAGSDPIDNIKFAADEGFRAMFDNGFMGKSPGQQEAIAREMARLDMTLGPFIAYAEFGKATFVTGDKEVRTMLADKMKQAVEVKKRTGAKWALIVPGRYDEKLQWNYQTANVIENLKYCAEVCEPSGLVMVIEPLNTLRNHPGVFLTGIPQAYQICRAVGSPSCKIVNDLYHQQITEGNLIPNIDMAWGEIAAFHVGDNPGRKEPTTGEINYGNIFKHIHQKGYDGVLCMEHGASKGKTKEAERAVIDAYRACDDF